MMWKDFEEFVKKFIAVDNPVLPPGSGSSKKEEDVVGRTLICQCKHTDSDNISILSKDMERLLEASTTLDKIPLFFNQSNANKVLSIPITKNTEYIIGLVIKLIVSFKDLQQIRENLKVANERTIHILLRQLEESSRKVSRIKSIIENLVNDINNEFKTRMDDLTMYNLFDGENKNVI